MSKVKSNKADGARIIKLDKLRRELNYSRYNISRAEKEWKQICIQITIPKLREELIHSWHYYEKVMDIKDYVISLHMDDIRKQEDTYSLNLRKHQENMETLMMEYHQSLREIHSANNDTLMGMIQRSFDDWQDQMYQTSVSENYLKVMKFGLEALSKRWNQTMRTNYFARLNEEFSRHHQGIQELSYLLELKVEDLWIHIREAECDYFQRISENKKHHDMLKEVDDATNKNIQKELNKLMNLQELAKRLANKFKDIVSDIGKKLTYVQQEKESLHELQFALRTKLAQDKANDELKRVLVSVEFLKTFEALREQLKMGERMMMVVKGTHRYERPHEKVLPYPQFGVVEKENNNSPPELRLFWQRMANADADRYALNEERIYLKRENQKLRQKIHSFCSCLQCPALPQIPKRTGKIPYTEGREMVKKQTAHKGKRRNFKNERIR